MASSAGLRELNLRSKRSAQEHRRWDHSMASHYYLSFEGLFGKALRHGSTLEASWTAHPAQHR